ncbi:hypothetical protein SeseC_02398 [Streptococcus equi subsp. zooepidemicus ATCC 35246]|uniref:Uncharacterized protein n=1 Tax=Streptococcus equi subsp. ruminatorum CECT 5772 TaxID=1051981 RepID=A0A922T6F0_9STRE|nr:hypothetical protein SeseC_02398 [Streptococcus equi subsp. zooepidemicus ATCC 35246]AIA69006.1 hypothetical protein Q426_10315 [Streptococcus equi subsp. zooepidemicus CY]KED04764.1 hypothetical protein CECT5772_03594 [Streptococcus equi subsp. ruminatorum CECT 5772]
MQQKLSQYSSFCLFFRNEFSTKGKRAVDQAGLRPTAEIKMLDLLLV